MAQRQFRSDDTSKWLYGFGNGSDGALTISSNTTEAPIDASCSGTSGQTSLSATNASFAAGQLLLIHQSRGTGVGAWELNRITSYTAGTITLTHALCNTYTDSGASQAQVRVMKQYTDVTIDSGDTYTTKAWDQNVGGILAFFAKGAVTVTGTITAAGGTGGYSNAGPSGGNAAGGTGGGYIGGYGRVDDTNPTAGQAGEGTSGAPVVQVAANGSGGGSGSNQGGGQDGAGGGNGEAGSNGSTNTTTPIGGSAAGVAALTTMVFGGGGGGGVRYTTSTGDVGGGGSGGGIVLIIAKTITVTGSISTNGGTGYTASGDGGGGAGGSILIKSQIATLGTTKATALKGESGTGTTVGDGGIGRIHLDYGSSYTGTTSPTIDASQDKSLLSSSGFVAFL